MPSFFLDPRKYTSHLLILISAIISFIGFIFPTFQGIYGFHVFHILGWDIFSVVTQVTLFQFIHANIIHLFMNSYFLYTAGPLVESRMSRDRFTAFFICTTLFIALALYFLAPLALTIGISGFCMALLSYLWIDLYTQRHPMTSQIFIMLIINIGIGLVPGISLVGHAAGALWGVIWWKFRNINR